MAWMFADVRGWARMGSDDIDGANDASDVARILRMMARMLRGWVGRVASRPAVRPPASPCVVEAQQPKVDDLSESHADTLTGPRRAHDHTQLFSRF